MHNLKAPNSNGARLKRCLWTAVVIVVGSTCLGLLSINWFLLKRTLRARFPDVNWISTQDLANLLANDKKPPILLDVRTEEEWAVSHLPAAQRVEPGSSAQQVTATGDKGALIVTYCAVGYRSAELAQRLQKAGFTQVKNLDGSIFQWANESRPLVSEGRKVRQVHPYDRFWGRLLRKEIRAPLRKR